jgi:hypothetical protein
LLYLVFAVVVPTLYVPRPWFASERLNGLVRYL